MALNNDNDNINPVELNKAQKSFGMVYSDGGVPVDLVKIAVIAATVCEQLLAYPEMFGGAPETFPDPEDPEHLCFSIRDAAEWACMQTEYGARLPGLIKETGACFRRRDGMPFLISALARGEVFATICAERFGARFDPTELLEEKLVGYLEMHGYRLVFEVLQKASTREESCMLTIRQLRELVLDHSLETKTGLYMPTSGLTRPQLGDVIESWMSAHDTEIHRLLGYIPEFGAEYE